MAGQSFQNGQTLGQFFEPLYAALYMQCMQCFPEVVKSLAPPDMFHPPSATFTLQASHQTRPQPPAAHPIPNTAPALVQQPVSIQQPADHTSEINTFFSTQPWVSGCAFCTQPSHMVHQCPAAREYVDSGCAKIKNSHIHLPNGQPVPNDSSGCGLKYGIDTWLAANIAPISNTSTVPAHPSNTIPFQCDAPPHIALHFEAIRSEVHMAEITDTTDSADPPSGNSTDNAASELYNLHEVLATEWRKCDARLPKPQNPPLSQPPPPITTTAPI